MRSRHYAVLLVVLLAFTSSASAQNASAPGLAAPLNETLPTITGIAMAGQKFLGDAGTWKGPSPVTSYQWARCSSSGTACVLITSATGQSYLETNADVGFTLRLVVTESNKNGSAVSTSNPTPVVTGATTTPPPPTTTTSTSTTTTTPTMTSTSTSTTTSTTSADTQAPTVPTNLSTGAITTTSVTLTFSASTDNITVAGYELFRNGTKVWTLTDGTTSLVYGGLTCGTSYTLGVNAFDTAGNHSATASKSATTLACPTTTTTSTTTTTTSQATGSVLYGENWESGTLDGATWIHQCSDNVVNSGGIVRGTVTPTTATFDAGSWSGRFDLPADGVNRQGCEFLHNRSTSVGTDDYYSLAFRLPTGYAPPPYVFESIYQLNYYGLNAAPVEAMVNWTGGINLLINTGSCTPSAGCQNYSGQDCCSGYGPRGLVKGPFWIVPSGSITPGTWYEAIVHVHWTVGTDGVVESWYRPRGGAWTKTVDLHGGFPTLQWGTSINSGSTYTAAQIAGLPSVDKFGMYRGAASFPTSIWHDDFCRATTFAAAASCSS